MRNTKHLWKPLLIVIVVGLIGVSVVFAPTTTAAVCDVVVQPGDSLKDAVDQADPGDFICLADGTHTCTERIWFNKSLTITGQSGDKSKVTIENDVDETNLFAVESTSDVGFFHFTVDSTKSTYNGPVFWLHNSDEVDMAYVDIINFWQQALYIENCGKGSGQYGVDLYGSNKIEYRYRQADRVDLVSIRNSKKVWINYTSIYFKNNIKEGSNAIYVYGTQNFHLNWSTIDAGDYSQPGTNVGAVTLHGVNGAYFYKDTVKGGGCIYTHGDPDLQTQNVWVRYSRFTGSEENGLEIGGPGVHNVHIYYNEIDHAQHHPILVYCDSYDYEIYNNNMHDNCIRDAGRHPCNGDCCNPQDSYRKQGVNVCNDTSNISIYNNTYDGSCGDDYP